jgi:hypothetical protein
MADGNRGTIVEAASGRALALQAAAEGVTA